MPTSERDVETASGSTEVVLARGCSTLQLEELKDHFGLTATTAPTELEARRHDSDVPAFGELIEFTTDADVATRFATGGYLVLVQIQKKYLTRSGNSSGGWICRKDAPFKLLGVEKRSAFPT